MILRYIIVRSAAMWCAAVSVRHDYVTQNGKVVRETVTTDGTVTAVMDFIYDESGSPFALRHSTNGSSFTTYYYVLNLQGDVVKLVNANGTAYATYTYNAWGEVLTATGSMANINPLRYRGYYYDTETGFYYLQSRYYDPANHRFINADSYESTGQGFVGTNMFAYCNNIPTSFRDDSGHRLSPTVALHESTGGRSGNIIIGGDGENANIDNMMQFFGVSLPEELPDLGTDTMVF